MKSKLEKLLDSGKNLFSRWANAASSVGIAACTAGLLATLLVDCTGKEEQPKKNKVSEESWEGKIAFVRDGDIYSKVYGEEEKRVTKTQGREQDIALSPDGSKIAYSIEEGVGDAWHIYVIPARGGSASKITNESKVNLEPCWSPDGKYLAFAVDEEGNGGFDIGYKTADGRGSIKKVTDDKSVWDRYPDWSRDGKIVFARNFSDLCAVSRDGKDFEVLLTGLELLSDPSCGPDGKTAYAAYVKGHHDIFVRNKDGEVTKLTDFDTAKGFGAKYLAWSPNGEAIAFAVSSGAFHTSFTESLDGRISEVKNRSDYSSGIWVLKISAGYKTKITADTSCIEEQPTWGIRPRN